MRIQSVTLQGFRCFGPSLTTIRLSRGITALVGANGSGKTAFLEALSRVFGVTRDQRTIRYADFYVPPDRADDNPSALDLSIDIRFAFPELEKTAGPRYAVAPCFNHLAVAKPGGAPFCRVLLTAKWADDGTVDGNIEQKLWWVITDDDIPTEEQKKMFEPHERGLIQVHYVPATRDASTQLTYTTGALASRLLRAVIWSTTTRETVQKAAKNIREAFGKERAIQEINRALTGRWENLHDAEIDAEPELHPISRRFNEVVRQLGVAFRPSETGGEHELETLSDGQKSLFYFSLAAAVFDVEQKLLESAHSKKGVDAEEDHTSSTGEDPTAETEINFDHDKLQTPSLTVFALEEPENHLAPYFLARIVKQVRSLVSSQAAQAVFTSHCPAILGRIDPTEVRHFRLNWKNRTTIIREVKLPDVAEEAAKYVREAVVAYPELYFAQFAILTEGASEQIVIPRLASALALDVDPAFVAVIPLETV